MTTALRASKLVATRARRWTLEAFALVSLLADVAFAHELDDPPPIDVWSAWSLDPLILLGIVAAAALYVRGTRRLWQRAGPGRGVSRIQALYFGLGILALAVALISPLDAMGSELFSAHMVQHEVLMLMAAPLLVLGEPLVAFVWAFPRRWRVVAGKWVNRQGPRSFWRGLSHPASAWVLHALALWIWHIPSLFQRTLESGFIHALQHASFLGTALLFWWAILGADRVGRGIGVLYVFTTAVHNGVLGALLTIAPRPWYPAYDGRTERWGLTLLEDQQLGGLIMWVPAGVVYLLAALLLLASWIRPEHEPSHLPRPEHPRPHPTARLGGALGFLAALGDDAGDVQSMLQPAGEQARAIAQLWWLLFAISAVIWIVVMVLVVAALVVGRSGTDGSSDARRTRLVVAATVLTTLVLIVIFATSLRTGAAVHSPDAEDMPVIEVVGYRWWWEVRAPIEDAGEAMVTANELHLPAGRTVLLRLGAADVIHSFWIPSLHGKIDMIPGTTNELRLTADRPGVYRGQCAEFCGTQHANMAFAVVIESPEAFERWRRRRPPPEPTDPVALRGREVFLTERCSECHTIRGTPATGDRGPDLTHLASRRTLAAGMFPNTRGHLGGWLSNPQQLKPGNNMPHVPLSGEELTALLRYLETLE